MPSPPTPPLPSLGSFAFAWYALHRGRKEEEEEGEEVVCGGGKGREKVHGMRRGAIGTGEYERRRRWGGSLPRSLAPWREKAVVIKRRGKGREGGRKEKGEYGRREREEEGEAFFSHISSEAEKGEEKKREERGEGIENGDIHLLGNLFSPRRPPP